MLFKTSYVKGMCKKLLVMLICTVMAFQLCEVPALAESSSDDTVIETLFEEINTVVSQYNKGIISESERDEQLAEIDSSLEKLGVEQLSDSEIAAKGLDIFDTDSSISPQAIVPGTTKNTLFESERTKDSTGKYEIQTITVFPLTEKSSLAESDMVTMNQKADAKAGSLNVCKITLATAATTLIKKVNVAYTAYDLLHSTYTAITGKTKLGNSKVVYDYDIQTNVCFKYIKKVGQSDDKQKLCQIATRYDGYCNTYYKKFTYNSSSYTSESIVKKVTIETMPKQYNSDSAALNYYLGKTSVYKYYVPTVTISGMESRYVLNVYPPTPSFPSQIS